MEQRINLTTHSNQLLGELSPSFLSPPPIHHERLKEKHMFLPDEQIKTPFAKNERTDLARFHTGHHPALHRRRQLERISKDAVCRLCGEVVKSAEHTWLQCPTLLMERRYNDIGHTMDELVRILRAALALLMIILRRLQYQEEQQPHHRPAE